jgi:hypothetical protein
MELPGKCNVILHQKEAVLLHKHQHDARFGLLLVIVVVTVLLVTSSGN